MAQPDEDNWNRPVAETITFVEKHKRPPSTNGWEPHEQRLGRWVSAQRNAYGKGFLTRHQIFTLEAIPHWTWKKRSSDWLDAFDSVRFLVEWNDKLPRGNDANSFVEQQLARWISAQKMAYHNKRLQSERVLMLESIPGWTWANTTRSWQSSYDSLQGFLELHGKSPGKDDPKSGEEYGDEEYSEEHQLWQWVQTQQSMYQGTNGSGKISPWQIAQLEQLPGWKWKVHQRRTWESSLRRLKHFRTRHGKWPSLKAGLAEHRLALWVRNQRQYFHTQSPWMTAERIAELEKIPGWEWSPWASGKSEPFND